MVPKVTSGHSKVSREKFCVGTWTKANDVVDLIEDIHYLVGLMIAWCLRFGFHFCSAVCTASRTHYPVNLFAKCFTSKIIFSTKLSAYYVCSIDPFNMCFPDCVFTVEVLMLDESGSGKISSLHF